jgi:prepilin-type N-terminal cleavage/methylation domain-containing protein
VGSRFPRRRHSRRNGFTLLEALVALSIVLAFVSVLGPFLFHARRIMVGADDRVAAHTLLRALLADPLDPAGLATLSRDGESAGLQWHIGAEPTAVEVKLPRGRAAANASPAGPAQPPRDWVAYRVVASVSWGTGQLISGETLRLGK